MNGVHALPRARAPKARRQDTCPIPTSPALASPSVPLPPRVRTAACRLCRARAGRTGPRWHLLAAGHVRAGSRRCACARRRLGRSPESCPRRRSTAGSRTRSRGIGPALRLPGPSQARGRGIARGWRAPGAFQKCHGTRFRMSGLCDALCGILAGDLAEDQALAHVAGALAFTPPSSPALLTIRLFKRN